MQKKNLVFLSMLALLLLASCTSYKKVPYMQNSSEWADVEQAIAVHEPRVMPNDMLSIIVSNPDNPASSLAYNLIASYDPYKGQSLTSQPTFQNYLVDSDGYVTMPNIGKLMVGGKTISEVEQSIFDLVKNSFSSVPVVIVRFVDFKISVLGEVTAPGTYTIKNGKVTLLEALSLARDLTIYGQRENVKIVREAADGKRTIAEVNLNDVSLLNSPYYYLQQNDIVYVTPNKSKAKNSDIGSSTSLWFSGTSILISLASLLYNILNK